MPKVARIFIKTGLVYFLCALLFGIALEINALHFASIEPLFWHLLMLGWVTQIIFGVSMWMFPNRTKEESFSAQKWAWITYFLLNSGLILRIITEPMLVYSSNAIWKILIIISAVIQFIAVISYIIELWPRILSKKKMRKKRKRKRKKKANK